MRTVLPEPRERRPSPRAGVRTLGAIGTVGAVAVSAILAGQPALSSSASPSQALLTTRTDGDRVVVSADDPLGYRIADAAHARRSAQTAGPAELGVRFTLNTAGTITGVSIYSTDPNEAHRATLWDPNGDRLASVKVPKGTPGWQTARFIQPVNVKAHTQYTISYHESHFRRADTGTLSKNTFSEVLEGERVYRLGTANAYPRTVWESDRYYVTAMFQRGAVEGAQASLSPVATRKKSPGTAPTATPPSASNAPTRPSDPSPSPTRTPTPSSVPTEPPTTPAPVPSNPAPSPADPSSNASFPSASTTGVPTGTSLTRVPQQLTSGVGWHWDSRGWVQVDKSGVTLKALDIDGSVQAGSTSRLTLADSRVRCTGERDWCVALGSASVISDTEIGGQEDGHTYGHAIGVLSGDYAHAISPNLIERVNIHHTIHGMRIDGDTTVIDSYIHDLPMGDAPYQTDHTDGIMSTAGGNIAIRHNRIECGNTATLFVQWEPGNTPIGSYVVENNLFVNITKNGEVSSWGVAIEDKGIANPSQIVVRDNTFTRGWQVGPIEVPGGATVTGNTYIDDTPARAIDA